MKRISIVFLIIAALTLASAIVVPSIIYRSGSTALPQWAASVRPRPLSNAHAFLEGKCESCHTPNRGIKSETCIACHASAPELLMKPATAFHVNVTECAGCHVEHEGKDSRPVRMDHTVLEKIARQSTNHSGGLTANLVTRPETSITVSLVQTAPAAILPRSGKSADFSTPALNPLNVRSATRRRRAIT